MKYTISYKNPNTHFIDIGIEVHTHGAESVTLQLPAWRPGRYELGNFAKNVQRFWAEDADGNLLPVRKITKDQWKILTHSAEKIFVFYNYYAFQMDAGSSWLDEHQLYINFINCMLYDPNRLNEPCEVHLDIPDNYIVACSMHQKHKVLLASNFYELVESPMIASDKLEKLSFELNGHHFHLWFMGYWNMDEKKLIKDFERFAEEQINMMGSFPCSQYHFLYQILPYQHYHGVEHLNSTVITLGPAEKMSTREYYENLLGVSSHELFHTWNVIRIKPKEFRPYDFSKENYFDTGFVAEGFTTYYGDLFLVRSGVFSKDWYFKELNKLFERHFENYGRYHSSLSSSSMELWLDGYQKGIPDRKVSIYVKGAIVALMLDLTIRKHTNNKASLDTVMKSLWENFGTSNIGYTQDDIKEVTSTIAGIPMDNFFDRFISGTILIEEQLSDLLENVGCELIKDEPDQVQEKSFGFRTSNTNGWAKVTKICPDSPAEEFLSLEDEIIAVDGRRVVNNLHELLQNKMQVEISVFRNHKLHTIQLKQSEHTYFSKFKIKQLTNSTNKHQKNFEAWLKCRF
ncbi:M61 family peptidase [Fulvivirgaceae bacterium BMA10]|uniref:M61 family peptidase n=1 Tax=Splendidivirga corallicola TaxID=3051826 RepID=A0ABT8KWC1_9BACT|nr:M61 family peptidase [Fulvivirgaceae bacterium BMA10]